MSNKKFTIEYKILPGIEGLDEKDRALVEQARAATGQAYAPYSHFHVAAVAQLANGQTLAATNQENASYPVGICAERTLLSALSSIYPGEKVETIAVAYHNINNGNSDKPASPCGLCRQSLLESEQRQHQPIRLLLTGFVGPVMVIEKSADLLPFGFGPADLLG